MVRLRTWPGAVFALGMACACGPVLADTPDPADATMAPVASAGALITNPRALEVAPEPPTDGTAVDDA
mgnify:CR=1 FL=1